MEVVCNRCGVLVDIKTEQCPMCNTKVMDIVLSDRSGDSFDINITYPDYSVYCGTMKNGKREGHGEMWYPDGMYVSGEWKDDNIIKGITKYINGDKYDGEYIDGKKNGFGRYTYSSQDVYEGYYKNDLPNGEGTIINYQQNIIFKGYFEDGQEKSFGKYIYPDGKTIEGIFVNGEFNPIKVSILKTEENNEND